LCIAEPGAHVHRLKIKAQFQAAMAGQVVAKTAHFALHRLVLTPVSCAPEVARLALPLPDVPPVADQASVATPVKGRPLFAVPGVWMGALVPKRWARCAVTRNAIRRQIYAVAQIRESRLLPAAYVVRLRQGFDRTRFVSASSDLLRASVRHELQQLFDRNPGAGANA
jgi:ribonuclease P protein component